MNEEIKRTYRRIYGNYGTKFTNLQSSLELAKYYIKEGNTNETQRCIDNAKESIKAIAETNEKLYHVFNMLFEYTNI